MPGTRNRRTGRRYRPSGQVFYSIALFLGRYADARGRHFAGPVHAQLIEHARAGPQIGRQALSQARDVEEDVPSAIVRTQEAKAIGIEIGDHRAARKRRDVKEDAPPAIVRTQEAKALGIEIGDPRAGGSTPAISWRPT